MQKLKHVCFLVMAKMSLVIDYMIQLTKKLIRSRDVVFVEDQTIAYIEKIDEPESKHSDILIDLSSTSLTQSFTQIEDEVQNEQFFYTDESSEQVGIEDGVQEQLVETVVPTDVSLRRSVRDRRPSTRYSPNEYLLLTDGGEPESYEEAIEDEHKNQLNDAMKDEMESLHAKTTPLSLLSCLKEKLH